MDVPKDDAVQKVGGTFPRPSNPTNVGQLNLHAYSHVDSWETDLAVMI
jgi:hypothetical protein